MLDRESLLEIRGMRGGGGGTYGQGCGIRFRIIFHRVSMMVIDVIDNEYNVLWDKLLIRKRDKDRDGFTNGEVGDTSIGGVAMGACVVDYVIGRLGILVGDTMDSGIGCLYETMLEEG